MGKRNHTTLCCLLSVIIFFLVACSGNKNASTPLPPSSYSLYFPPIDGSNTWATIQPDSLGWDMPALNNLYDYLQSKDTKAFIILKNGKIAVEKYFGTFTSDSTWYWASAGKTLTAFLVGIAQEEGLIDINKTTSSYIGSGWSSEPADKENLITVKNQLTMTTGLDDGVADNYCTLPSCLKYIADAGTRWAYHTDPYTLLDSVIERTSGIDFNQYFQQKIRDRIGMKGLWFKIPHENNIYYSNARSMARFGLLMLNKGKWDTAPILSDTNYFNQQINTSQNLNESYGYLTWLNGKNSYMVPGSQLVLPGYLISNGPADMYAALGKNDQKIYVIPSMQLVVIRMGETAGGYNPAPSGFDNELWGKLKTVIGF
ncbi:MAG: serine hydrolase [Bacteroidetes bacterium]|nr:serine hydrolase [Bacteroidota bacterium]